MIARIALLSLLLLSSSAASHSQLNMDNQTSSSIPSDVVITLAERGCLVKITAEGTVAFEGQTFDFDINRVRTKLSAEELKKLICEFERINYFSLKDRYRDKEDGCPELGSPEVDTIILTSMTRNGRSKSVTHFYHSCLNRDGSPYPHELAALEKSIETVVELKRR